MKVNFKSHSSMAKALTFLLTVTNSLERTSTASPTVVALISGRMERRTPATLLKAESKAMANGANSQALRPTNTRVLSIWE